jgi:SPP1 family predicted phage head-tail adaptor
MRAGTLRQRARVQRLVRNDDDMGGSTQSFIDTTWIWCNVSTDVGRELYEAKKVKAEVSHLVTVRYGVDVHFRDRLVIGSLVLDVDSVVDPTGRHQELHLLCIEVVQ